MYFKAWLQYSGGTLTNKCSLEQLFPTFFSKTPFLPLPFNMFLGGRGRANPLSAFLTMMVMLHWPWFLFKYSPELSQFFPESIHAPWLETTALETKSLAMHKEKHVGKWTSQYVEKLTTNLTCKGKMQSPQCELVYHNNLVYINHRRILLLLNCQIHA